MSFAEDGLALSPFAAAIFMAPSTSTMSNASP
jgi:hypothetical protein